MEGYQGNPLPFYRAGLHRIAHWFGWQRGFVVSALDDRGTVWIGFRCARCGRVEGIHADYSQQPAQSRFSR